MSCSARRRAFRPKEETPALGTNIPKNVVTAPLPLRYGVRVDAKGVPQAIAVYKSPDERFTKAVAYQLINTDYKPARCHGKPCPGEYIFDFDFKVSH